MKNVVLSSPLSYGKRAFAVIGLLLSFLMVPSAAFAAGGENVKLEFTGSDMIYLYVSLAFGVIALLTAWALGRWVNSQSKGSEKMIDVGTAIHDGAMAYLKQQFKTMGIFVVLLAALLFAKDLGLYGWQGGFMLAIAFIAGVLASYVAGYAGMKMAVGANMRSASAALTSYARALEIAFRSGAVAGLVTVGMGLLGATLIFMIFQGDAMHLLVGFGFGGSLAALFMRVGGGIFTKAADVGADLVGKVEAGIPEDDPRNPATIADNVGDNVGDCAGMAADVFESYEVTLVAAIVLGAATAAIFDTETWTRLVLFALMARGVGIIASIVGIFFVKGSDNVDADPLKPISGGFKMSALIAAIATFALAFFMMGGTGTKIVTSQLVSTQQLNADEYGAILTARDEIAAEQGILPQLVPDKDLREHPSVEALGLSEADLGGVIAQATNPGLDLETLTAPKVLRGYTKVDFSDEDSTHGKLAIVKPVDPADPMAAQSQEVEYTTLGDFFKDKNFVVQEIKFAEEGQDAQTIMAGPAEKSEIEAALEQYKQQAPGASVEVLNEFPVEIYANAENDILFGVPDTTGKMNPARLAGLQPLRYFTVPEPDMTALEEVRSKEIDELIAQRSTMSDELDGLNQKREDLQKRIDDLVNAGNTAEAEALGPEMDALEAQITDLNTEINELAPTAPNPVSKDFGVALVEHKTVGWYLFALCILFGIVMAFVFERLTDYYVSLHGKPVTEVANIATTGPAPMIITGFAYGKESSVFSVFAIVLCLIAPLLIFPAAVFGGYLLSFYGIALVGLGLLTTTGYILAMDTFGPISDNAQGVFEMSGAGHENPEAAKAVQRLDAAGNTTKALTKGFAIATAVVAAVALFHAFVEEAHLDLVGMKLEVPEIFLGLLLGGAAPYLFSAFSMNAVGRAAFELINEVRRQFREDKGILEGTSRPEYGRCVAIVTAAAQKELLGPGILAIAFPVLVAFGFSIGKEPTFINGQLYNLVGAQALGGFLAGTILSGQLLAVLLANSGGLWDNAKKLIEDGLHGGKGTEAHKAAVVCDTVGDPFKDTAGPALNPLIKVMNLVALLIAPTVIQPLGNGVLITVTLISAAGLVGAIWWSKRGSMSTGLDAAGGATAE